MGKISFIEYFNNLFQVLSVEVIAVSIIKSLIFGMVISVVSTMYGFNVERASTEIPQAGIQAVGKAFMLIIITDVIVTVLSYILH
jgi:ABC-type transporter Mla maintaining outer membrane lipid asymmetry permease subunit MlaE